MTVTVRDVLGGVTMTATVYDSCWQRLELMMFAVKEVCQPSEEWQSSPLPAKTLSLVDR